MEGQLLSIRTMDELARQETAVHALDPRAKLLTTIAFVVTVVSYGKHEISALFPLILYPIVLTALGRIPLGYLAKKVLLAAPFAVMLGMFNPLLDREPVMALGSVPLSGGWISFASILVRFVLTVWGALALVAVTGLNGVGAGLEKLGAPRVFVMQLLFLYRYLFVLAEEAARMLRASALRSAGRRRRSIRLFGHLAGHLLLRTLDRAQRTYQAMCCRGFQGEVRLLRPLSFGAREAGFVCAWALFFVLVRANNLPLWLGDTARELVK